MVRRDPASGCPMRASAPMSSWDSRERRTTEFEATLDVVRRAELSYLHPFPVFRPARHRRVVNARQGAGGRDPTARGGAARGRRALRRAFASTQVGMVREALTLRDPTVALTDNYLKVRIPPGLAPNERVAVRITSAGPLAGIHRVETDPNISEEEIRAAPPGAGPVTSRRPRR